MMSLPAGRKLYIEGGQIKKGTMMYRVALKMLMGDTSKYIGIIIGVTFAALIMTQQPAIFVGLMSRTFGFIQDTRYPDLWIMDPKLQFVDDIKPIQDTELLRVRGVEGVAWAVPMYKSILRARTETGSFENVIIIGLDDATMIGGPGKMVAGRLADLRRSDAIILDTEGAKKLSTRTDKNGAVIPLGINDTIEINDKRAVIVGIAEISKTFQWLPMVYTTYTRALNYAPAERLKLSFILAGLKPGTDAATVSARIKERTDLLALTNQEFSDMTLNYFMEKTGIPINFGISTLLGFLVGAAIAGQMFYNFTHENLRQFGALKAMGASTGMLVRMIILQALLVGFTGWGIGVGLASWFGFAMRKSVLAFKLVPGILLISAAGVFLIITIASLISIRKVVKLEPAIVFKS
jgi:putative ABC transport system permease protein